MRTALILARKHTETCLAVISGPEIPFQEQVTRFKQLVVDPSAHDFALAEFWESDQGRTRSKKFVPRDTVNDLAEELAKLDVTVLCELAERHGIDLAGKAEKLEIITAIVLGVRARYNEFVLNHGLEESSEQQERDGEIPGEDPGIFDGPSLPPEMILSIPG